MIVWEDNVSNVKVANRQVGLLHFPGLVHFTVVLIVTGVEILGLTGWLQLLNGVPLSTVLGPFYFSQIEQALTALGVNTFAGVFLGAFLIVEHVIAQMDHTGMRVTGRQFAEIFGFSSLEVVIWGVWFLLIPINGLVAFLFFFGGLFVEHQITDNVKKGQPFLHFARLGSWLATGLLIFTVFEVVGGVLWLGLASVIPLAIGSTIEHYIARNVGQIHE